VATALVTDEQAVVPRLEARVPAGNPRIVEVNGGLAAAADPTRATDAKSRGRYIDRTGVKEDEARPPRRRWGGPMILTPVGGCG